MYRNGKLVLNEAMKTLTQNGKYAVIRKPPLNTHPCGIYLFKASNGSTRATCEICLQGS